MTLTSGRRRSSCVMTPSMRRKVASLPVSLGLISMLALRPLSFMRSMRSLRAGSGSPTNRGENQPPASMPARSAAVRSSYRPVRFVVRSRVESWQMMTVPSAMTSTSASTHFT